MSRSGQLALIMSGAGKKQVDRDTPLSIADLTSRINVTSRNWVNTDKTIEDIFDCIGEDVVSREVTRIIRRLPIEGDFSAKTVAPLWAYLKGVAATPVGARVNTEATVTVTATGGYYVLTLEYDGVTSVSAPIPFDATAGEFKHAIESMDNIGYGNTTVSLAGGVYTITFIGKRASASIPAFTVDNAAATGGTAVAAVVTPGSQRAHAIEELAGYQPPYTTFGILFEDTPGSERLIVGATLANIRLRGEAGGRVRFTGDIIARDLIPAPTLDAPECIIERPIRTADCAFSWDGADLTDNLRDFELFYDNGTLTGNSAYTGRGVKPSRLNRASRRGRSLTVGLLGDVLEEMYLQAEVNPEADIKKEAILRVGTPGDNITETIPNGLIELSGGTGLEFDGESEESINRFIITPTKQGLTKPTSSVANVDITATLLST